MGKITVMCTGGTFDKVYALGAGVRDLSFAPVSAVEKMCEEMRVDCNVRYHPLGMRDSLDIDEDYRKVIFSEYRARVNVRPFDDRWIIIHGTDTMIETAQYLDARLLNGVIVLTGASRPATMKDSDAIFNFGLALGAVQSMQAGVFIAMHGRVFECDKCRKNPETGFFESL